MNPATPGADPRLWVGIAQASEIAPEALTRTAARLGPRDAQRLRSFGSEKRRREFLLGRWILGQSRQSWLKSVSAGLAFDSAPDGGTIEVIARKSPTRFRASLSHAAGWAACVLIDDGLSGVGIDIEPMRTRDYPAMDETAFHAGEHAPLRLLPIEAHREEFYLRWTRHEARFKATGGMPCPHPGHEQSWGIHDSLMLSLCVIGHPGPIQILEWDPHHGFRVCESVRPISPHTAPSQLPGRAETGAANSCFPDFSGPR